jgi:hypothetical protein
MQPINMVKEDNRSDIIEKGDIFFFYRPKVGTEEVENIRDVQRFYMVTSPEVVKNKKKKDIYRLFLVGQKQLPEIVEGKSTSEEKNWALNVLTTYIIQMIYIMNFCQLNIPQKLEVDEDLPLLLRLEKESIQ